MEPAKRNFVRPQMVTTLKTVCGWRLTDVIRHQSVIKEVPLGEAEIFQDHNAGDPGRLAEMHEAAQIGLEALLSLLPRDREVFWLRQMDFSPEEIQQRMLGRLSNRSYRKRIERANGRIGPARERIESGERCRAMTREAWQDFIAKTAPAEQLKAVEAHLKHCRRCRQDCARVRRMGDDPVSE